MRRADRLFQIIQLLRLRKVVTASYLAEELEVSERTIYRDINDLSRSGVPIHGEAGVGYALLKGFDIPPLMFTEDELEAVTLGIRMVAGFTDHNLSKAAHKAIQKIEAVVPDRLKPKISKSRLFSPNINPSQKVNQYMPVIRQAISRQQKISISYSRHDGQLSDRTLRPLCLAFFAPYWLVSAWCELRDGFRNFRLDRISSLILLEGQFKEEPGKNLSDFLKMVADES